MKYIPFISDHLLLEKFNDRDAVAFSQVYKLFYNELFHFVAYIYEGTNIIPADIIHDIFIKVWLKSNHRFNSLENIKAYMFVAIKNNRRDHIDKLRSETKYKNNITSDREAFMSEIAETETLSIISQAINLLPSECAKVFKLCIDGWQVKDIAKELNKSESTVYAQKQEAISILKRKLPNKMLTVLCILIK